MTTSSSLKDDISFYVSKLFEYFINFNISYGILHKKNTNY